MRKYKRLKVLAGAMFALGLIVLSVYASGSPAVPKAKAQDLLDNNGILGDGILGGNGGFADLAQLVILDRLLAPSVTVERGDTLSGIAATFLGDARRFPEIARLNNISNPNLIFPGQVFRLPADGGRLSSNLTELIVLDRLFGN